MEKLREILHELIDAVEKGISDNRRSELHALADEHCDPAAPAPAEPSFPVPPPVVV